MLSPCSRHRSMGYNDGPAGRIRACRAPQQSEIYAICREPMTKYQDR